MIAGTSLPEMHVALTCCTVEESAAVRRRLGEACVTASVESVRTQPFDFVIVGSIAGHAAAVDAAMRAGVPHLLLLRCADEYPTIGPETAALALDDIDALPHLVRHEVRLREKRDPAGALAESERRYRNLVDRLPAAVWTSHKDGEILFVSDPIVQITGFSVQEFIDGGFRLWAGHIHPSDVGALFDKWNELFTKGEGSIEAEYRFLRKDGQWVWVQQRISLVQEEESEPYVVGISIDVTARRVAEEALRDSERRYRTLVEQARDIVFSLDIEGRFQSLNVAFETATGWPRETWIGKTFVELMEPESVPAAFESFRAALSGEHAGVTEYTMRTKWGHCITIEATSERVEVDGRVVGTIGIARDVTRRKESDAEVARDKRLASLGQLATSIAHEFNNVLMSIMPFAELLQRRLPDDERVLTSTRHIIQAVRRGREMTQEVLRSARPVKPEIDPVPVEGWVRDFTARAQTRLGPHFRVQWVIADEERDVVMCADRALLDLVASNLITNAREAMPSGGTITVEARRSREAGTIDIAIQDEGCGIPEPALEHVFEPLFTTKRHGSGLGLSVAYQAMKQQDGSIQVRSTVGAGSTFTLTLRESGSTVPAVPPREGIRRRLLIVEDDEAVGEGLRLLLTDEGFEVRLVGRGAEAVPGVSEFKPDVVLLDVNLPDISGIEVYERLKAAAPSVPIIFSTGHADARALEDVRRRQVPTIMKPYDVTELMAVIASLPA